MFHSIYSISIQSEEAQLSCVIFCSYTTLPNVAQWHVIAKCSKHVNSFVAYCSSDDLKDSVRACTSCDPSVETALSKMRSDGSQKLPDSTLEWEEVDGLIFYRGCLYIPDQLDLHCEILRCCHNAPAAGHPGQH
jgi:hypothetical protein